MYINHNVIKGKVSMLIASLCVIAFISCGEKTEKEETVDTRMAVAVTPTMDCLPMIVAVERGWTDSIGVAVRTEMFMAHNDCDTAFLGNSVVASFTDNIRAERMRKKLSGTMTFLTMEHDNLHWLLIAGGKQRISKASQLKDKMMGMTRNSATEVLAQHIMDSTKLGNQQLFLIPVNNVALRLKMTQTGQIDASWMPEPQASIALASGCKRLAASRTMACNVKGVFVVNNSSKRNKLSTKQAGLLKAAYNMACDSINRYGIENYQDIVLRNLGISEKELKCIKKTTFRHL